MFRKPETRWRKTNVIFDISVIKLVKRISEGLVSTVSRISEGLVSTAVYDETAVVSARCLNNKLEADPGFSLGGGGSIMG